MRNGGNSRERLCGMKQTETDGCMSSHSRLAVNRLLSSEVLDVLLLQWDLSLFPRDDWWVQTLLRRCWPAVGGVAAAAGGGALHPFVPPAADADSSAAFCRCSGGCSDADRRPNCGTRLQQMSTNILYSCFEMIWYNLNKMYINNMHRFFSGL